MAAYQAPLSLGFYRQEHWSGLPFPSPMHESEKWKWSHSVVSHSSQLHGLQPTRLLHPWDFPGKSTGVGCHCLLHPYWCIFLLCITAGFWAKELNRDIKIIKPLCVYWPSGCLFWTNLCLGLLLIFLIRLFVFLILSYISCLYILEINTLSVVSFGTILSHSEDCLLILFIVFFAVQKLLSLNRFHLYIFVFISNTLVGGSKRTLL